MVAVPDALPDTMVRPVDNTYPSLPPELPDNVTDTMPEPEPLAFNPLVDENNTPFTMVPL